MGIIYEVVASSFKKNMANFLIFDHVSCINCCQLNDSYSIHRLVAMKAQFIKVPMVA